MLLTVIYFVLFVLTSAKCCLGAGISSDIGCLQTEKTALLQFKQGLIDKSNVLASWKTGRDCCEWRGITCNNETGHVITLDLSYNYSDISHVGTPLSGVIAPSLLELPYLTNLDLSFNNFQGQIPKFIGSLSRLEQLKLAGANLSGPIPPQLGNLSSLYTLDLALNYVTFENLEWLSHLSSLRYLNMLYLNFSEVVNWPESISKLPSLVELHLSSCNLPNVELSSLSFVNSSNSLQVLELSYNILDLSIFYWMANVSTNLVHIGLVDDRLQGPFPDVFANMVSLVSLDLTDNKLEGGIPKSFQNLCSLESLNLMGNTLSDRLEDSIENLSCAQDTLEFLSLSWNPFSGSFPDNLARFSSLKVLYIEGTNVSGSLPKSFQPLSQLRYLSLSRNKFTGSLPDFTGLSLLRQLYISQNQLNGSLPESIGQLSSLEDLDLSWNSLSGVITEVHFSNLSRLNFLEFSHNPLSFNFSSDWNPPFQIKSLGLSSCKVGPAFPKWIQTQKKLTSLYMADAEISDSIPDTFWDLSSSFVELNLSTNQIHGKLPNLSTKNCTFFSFDLSSNLLDGPLPPFPSSVADLRLSQNMFSGPLSSFCKTEAPNLFNLDLSDNQLSGELPTCWMQFRSLFVLNMAKNNLSGKIPSSLGYLKYVVLLRLQDNKLSGELPSLENCTELRVLDLGDNKLSGMIPTWIGPSLTKLLVLRLKSNGFYGSIPLSLCSLLALHVLDFSKNNLSGALPHCLTNITALSSMSPDVEDNIIVGFVQLTWKGIQIEFGENLKLLRSIDISSNNLSGDIPESVTSLPKLISLNLSRNSFTGVLPNNFGQLEMLESLDLSRNQISGSIPLSFSSLHYLSVLDLSYNNLSGRIPLSTQLQSFNASQFTGNLGLCGQPLTPECPGDATTEDPAVPNGSGSDQTKQDDDGLISFGFYVSLALGFIIGFWSVCGTLVLKTSWRYAYFRFFDDIKARIM
ncbi:receptor-like protein EIX2 [Pyrus communis]|uniref:receptor-like protein EIX2 n=1 Tax=Pyrus communis TaxID=23211 RepID=UPI0035C200D2